MDRTSSFKSAIEQHLGLVRSIAERQDVLEQIASAMIERPRSDSKILWCGNGGSAADSRHLVAELVGRFRREQRSLCSLALTTGSSILTSVENEYGDQCVFVRQVDAPGQMRDVLVGISTSANSQNILRALNQARSLGLTTVASTARVQELHIFTGHSHCDAIEAEFANSREHDLTNQRTETR